nr:carbohydrate binding domain-containing protein [Cohnella fermenti]
MEQYEIYRNGVQVGTSASTSFADGNLLPSTTYVYTVKAADAAGNVSALSEEASIATEAGNVVTVYYKRGYATPYIHYRPAGGTWTTVPGVAMPQSEVTGYNVMTINIGTATALEAVFNNGSGTWDNNGGQNYMFQQGVWTYDAGTITAGAPTGTPVDTTPPSAPTYVAAASTASTTATVSWLASTDNVGVTGYKVYRDGTQIGTTTATSYTDSGLAANTTYSYTVRATDAAGNLSDASAAATVTTPAAVTYSATIYYKRGYATPYIHYAPTGGTWTTAPGIAMTASTDYPGYSVYTADLGTATSMQAVFNNGSGTWDNNGGQNYTFQQGTWTYDNGTITAGAPVVQPQSLTLQVSVPSTTTTSDTLYVSGTFNSWNPADPAYQLTRNSDGTYSIAFAPDAGTTIQFKITRGSWATVEAAASGADIANRSYTVQSGSQSLSITVAKWKDK